MEKTRKIVLEENEEDQDLSTEYFKMNFYDMFGIKFDWWKQKSERVGLENGTLYRKGSIEVEIISDHQFYVVYEVEDLEGDPAVGC